MQDWQNTNQASGPPSQTQGQVWQDNFAFTGDGSQFNSVQGWPQTLPGQGAFGSLDGRQNPIDSNMYGSAHHVPVTQASAGSGRSSAMGQGAYHSVQGQFNVDDTFGQPAQGQAMQGLGYGQDVYSQQGNPQFSQASFQYQGQTPTGFNGRMQQQYADPQLIAQSRSQNQTPLGQQRFESVPQQSFSPHDFAQASRPPPPQQQQQQQHDPRASTQSDRAFAGSPQQYQTQHAPPPQPQQFSNSTPAHFHQSPPPAAYQHQQAKFVPQHMAYASANSTAPFQSVPARQIPEHAVQQKAMSAVSRSPRPIVQQSTGSAAPSMLNDAEGNLTLKKQKRPLKMEPDLEMTDSPPDLTQSEAVAAPFSTEQELAAVAQFASRPAAAKKAFPAIPGARFLISPGTINIPFAKSYDRISPLVALPSRSGKKVLPGAGHDLPCEIQGRFADKYRPSANFNGQPKDREREAKPLLDEYQRDMKALGTRRPKYADYPFFYQEQLKADEAAKSKAQRKARKEEEEERKKPVRSPTRPVDPVEAAAWDMIGIVHIEVTAVRSNSLIGDAVRKLGEYLIKLRSEMTRARAEADEAAKTDASGDKTVKLKKEFESKKEAIVRACEAADKYGDDAVLENMGGHQKGCLSLVNSLIGCVKAADYSGRLPKAILRFMSNISMPKKVAEGIHFETVRKRFADKGDDEVKGLVRTIASRIKKEAEPVNAAAETKKSVAATGATAAGKAARLPASAATKPAASADPSTAKRPLEDDSADSRPGKKVNIDNSTVSLANKLSAPKQAGANILSAKLGAAKARPVSSSLAAKNRPVVKPPSKPDASKLDSSKADNMSPSTPMDTDQPTAKRLKLDAAKVASTKSSASSGSLSSIGSLLESINTRKPDAPSAKKDVNKAETNETPEQRAKRLRKESRRRLRVTWKPEPELTQVRIFHKEAAEDENNMTQDAADDRSEGMMLKRRAAFNDDDEEDEDELPNQGAQWVMPKIADTSRIDDEYRNKAFVNRGGTLEIRTDEQKAMEQREQNVLMVVYTSADDIPPTPKSPGPESSLPYEDAPVARLPSDGAQYDEIHSRLREVQQHGPEAAAWYAKRRLDAKSDPASKLQSILGGMQSSTATETVPEGYNYNMTPPQQHAQLAQLQAANSGNSQLYVPNADEVLALLKSDAVQKWRNPHPYNPAAPQTHRRYDYPDPALQTTANQLENVFELYKGLPYPANEPPKWMTDPERIREWKTGHQEASVRAQRAAHDRARAETEASAQRTQAQAQQQQQQQPSQSNQDAWAAYYQHQQAHQQSQQGQQEQDPYAMYMEIYQRMQNGQTQQPPQAAAAPVPGQSQLGDDQVQALLAQLSQPPQSQPQNAYGLNPNDQGYQQLMMLAQMQQQQQQPAPADDQRGSARQTGQTGELDYGDAYGGHGRDYGHEFGSASNRDRDTDMDGGREWERDREHRDRRDKHDKHGKARKGNAPGGATLAPHRPANKALIGTKPCVFWQQGKCARGDKCTFRHDN